MNMFVHRALGHVLMNEADASAGTGDAAAAQTADAATATTADVTTQAEPTSLLGDAEVKTDEASIANTDDQQAAGAPEAYEAFTAPEGIELDEKLVPGLNDLFKELNLPQEKAQEVLNKLIELDKARQPGEPTAEEQAAAAKEQERVMTDRITKLNQDWGNLCKQLPDLGGENFNKSLETCSAVMVKFATPELRELLTHSALGSNPEFFKFIHSIGAAMSEDTMSHGGERASGPRSIEERLYGKTIN